MTFYTRNFSFSFRLCKLISRGKQRTRYSLFYELDQPILFQTRSIHSSLPISSSSPLEHDETRNSNPESQRPTSKILYDGDCRLCQIEISALKRLARKKNDLAFVDISSPDYDPKIWGGVSYEDAMKEMHVVGADGKVYTQASAVRQLYKICGFGWLASLTELPIIRPVCDKLYLRFAEYRLRKAFDRCDSNSCDIKLKNLRDKIEKQNGLT